MNRRRAPATGPAVGQARQAQDRPEEMDAATRAQGSARFLGPCGWEARAEHGRGRGDAPALQCLGTDQTKMRVLGEPQSFSDFLGSGSDSADALGVAVVMAGARLWRRWWRLAASPGACSSPRASLCFPTAW